MADPVTASLSAGDRLERVLARVAPKGRATGAPYTITREPDGGPYRVRVMTDAGDVIAGNGETTLAAVEDLERKLGLAGKPAKG